MCIEESALLLYKRIWNETSGKANDNTLKQQQQIEEQKEE